MTFFDRVELNVIDGHYGLVGLARGTVELDVIVLARLDRDEHLAPRVAYQRVLAVEHALNRAVHVDLVDLKLRVGVLKVVERETLARGRFADRDDGRL